MDIEIPSNFTPRPYQKEIIDAIMGGYDKICLVWPRQIGKDTLCFAIMVLKAVMTPGNYFYVFPTKEDARRALWEKVMSDESAGKKLLDMIPQDPALGLVKRMSNHEMIIELNNNSTIRVVGLDTNPEAIRGISPTGVVFSEFAFSDPNAYKALIPALRGEGKWCIINSTPNGRNHFYKLYLNAQNDKEWYCSFKQGLDPNREGYVHIDEPSYFQGLINEGIMTREDIDREYGCDFGTGLKGAFYADNIEQARREGRIARFLPKETARTYTYWDIGVTDSTAIWFVQYDGNSAIFIDYYEDNGKGTDFYAEVLRDKGYEYDTHFLPHDAGNVKQGRTISTTADDLQDSLYEMKVDGDVEIVTKHSKQDGISAVRKKFKTSCFDALKCNIGLERLESYRRRWDKKTGNFGLQEVHDKASHAADALRTWAMSDDVRTHNYSNKIYNQIKVSTVKDYDIFGDGN